VELQRVTERDRALVERLARVTTDRYAVGQALQTDVVRAEIERTHVETRLATQAIAIESARAELAALLSSDGPVLGVPADGPILALPADESALTARALRERPEVRAQAEAIAREESGVQLARLGYLPDFEVAFARFVNAGEADGFGAMASMSVPLAFPSKIEAAAAEAAARLTAAKAQQRRVEDRVRREVRQGWLAARTALTQHELFRGRHVPHAEQALAATQSAYETGQTGATALFESVRAIEAVQLEHVTAAADFERAMATLTRAVGGEVPRDGALHTESHDAQR
jgi:outer membrane protein TolC